MTVRQYVYRSTNNCFVKGKCIFIIIDKPIPGPFYREAKDLSSCGISAFFNRQTCKLKLYFDPHFYPSFDAICALCDVTKPKNIGKLIDELKDQAVVRYRQYFAAIEADLESC